MTTLADSITAAYSRPISHDGPTEPLDTVRAELDRLAPHAPAAGVARAR